MDIKRSRGYKAYKKEVGQDNHFLITILIGLEGVKNGVVIKDESFKTSWNPLNTKDSAMRSRDFAIKATLAWLVDNIDAYFMNTYSKPKLIQNADFESKYTAANQSVYRRYKVFIDHMNNLPIVEQALIDLAINWRNRLVHSNADNPISAESRSVLLEHKDIILDKYQGMQIEETLNNFSQKNTPKFKEITAIIRASMIFIEELDRQLIKQLDRQKYVYEIISYYINEVVQKRVNHLWGKGIETRKRQLKNILKSFSFVETQEKNDIDLYVEEIAGYTEAQIKEKFLIQKNV